MIKFEDFKKVELKIGEVKEVEKIKGSDKLLKMMVDFGGSLAKAVEIEEQGGEANEENDRDVRQVVSGIAGSYKPEELIGKQFLFVTNLEPRKIMGLESQAMILAVTKREEEKEKIALMQPTEEVEKGSELS